MKGFSGVEMTITSQFETMFTSFVHTDEDLEKTVKTNYNALVAATKQAAKGRQRRKKGCPKRRPFLVLGMDFF
ncbi:MAG TPA: hypothetical protein ENL07_08590 [Chlorobaculum parvum]|uniref:Uncharacterized protein n=1 Tax=Chlorobaculum parvum TaxID=274539 RepID=A0A7C5DEW1_9CHLB|nr:hypothetical protein [Chlorobaculum parvum]